jgi:hypothetical protein
MPRPQASFVKRQREQQKREKAAEKAEKRAQRKSEMEKNETDEFGPVVREGVIPDLP